MEPMSLIHSKMSTRSDVLLLLAVCGYLITTAQCQLCEEVGPSYYSTIGISVNCKNIREKFPPFVKPVSNLKCFDCNIPVLDENTIITNFRGDTFNLSNSHVRNISATALKSFGNTTHKFLFRENDIGYVAPRVFSNFSLLDEINLRSNNISQLANGVFENTTVAVLDLSHNHLSNITRMFAGLKVTKLDLSFNEITTLSQNTFDNTIFWAGRQWRSGLQQLDLSNNFIDKILPDTFKSPNSDNILRTLYLRNNRLTFIDNNTFSQLKYLRLLTVEENAISQLESNSFNGLTSLSTLILRNNIIEKIPPGMFADLEQLEFLDVSQNRLTTLSSNTFSGLAYLTKLNISHNNLRTFDDSHIVPLGRLIFLDVSDTKLTDLNLAAILEHHYKLKVLVINDNFWTCKHLVQMYRQMNQRTDGFDYPARHFDVPNLHGIACSQGELASYDDMTFNDFLSIIAQDRVSEDLFDSRINSEYGDLTVDDITSTIKSIRGMYYMLLVFTVVVSLLLVQSVVRCVCRYLHTRNILQNDKFSFLYAPNQDNVELI